MTLRVLVARFVAMVRRRRLDGTLAEEIGVHLDQLENDHRARGLSAQAAREAARRDFGGVESMKQTYREQSAVAIVDLIAKDLRFAGRTLRKNCAFTTTAAVTLALAIGTNTAMFSVVDAVLLRPLPYRSPEQLAMLWIGTPGQAPQNRPAFSTAEEWRRQSRTFADMAIFDPVSVRWYYLRDHRRPSAECGHPKPQRGCLGAAYAVSRLGDASCGTRRGLVVRHRPTPT